MNHYALVATTRDTRLVTYQQRSGYYVFGIDDEPPHFVKATAGVRATLVADPGPLTDRGLSWWNRKKAQLKRETTGKDPDPFTLRAFRQVGRGYVEVPVANLTDGFATFLEDATRRAVVIDQDSGNPQLNKDGKVLEVLPNGKVALAPALRVLERDFRGMGIHPEAIPGIIAQLVELQRLGVAAETTQAHIFRWLIPPPENLPILFGVLGFGIWFGLDAGVNTGLGALYAGTDRTWVLLVILAAATGLVVWFTRRDK